MRKPSFKKFKEQQLEILTNRPQCSTCGRGKYDPYRQYDEHGKVVFGCIDEFHVGHLVPISESNSWHMRKEAKKMRDESMKRLYALLYC